MLSLYVLAFLVALSGPMEDFEAIESELTFSIGADLGCRFIELVLIDDDRLENDESFSVELFGTENDTLVVSLTQSLTTVTITDNDREYTKDWFNNEMNIDFL